MTGKEVRSEPRSILIATGNPGKFREITAVLNADKLLSEAVKWVSLKDLKRDIPEPREDGATFLANAGLKATYYSKQSGMWALADDSGLEVDALHGAPGVNSAYFDERVKDKGREIRDPANNTRLIAALRDIPAEKRTARYHCILVLADGDEILATADGKFEGRIIDNPRGTGGFGYDPYFLVPEFNQTVAELTPEHKNAISHRGKALLDLRPKLHHLLLRL